MAKEFVAADKPGKLPEKKGAGMADKKKRKWMQPAVPKGKEPKRGEAAAAKSRFNYKHKPKG